MTQDLQKNILDLEEKIRNEKNYTQTLIVKIDQQQMQILREKELNQKTNENLKVKISKLEQEVKRTNEEFVSKILYDQIRSKLQVIEKEKLLLNNSLLAEQANFVGMKNNFEKLNQKYLNLEEERQREIECRKQLEEQLKMIKLKDKENKNTKVIPKLKQIQNEQQKSSLWGSLWYAENEKVSDYEKKIQSFEQKIKDMQNVFQTEAQQLMKQIQSLQQENFNLKKLDDRSGQRSIDDSHFSGKSKQKQTLLEDLGKKLVTLEQRVQFLELENHNLKNEDLLNQMKYKEQLKSLYTVCLASYK